MSRLIDAIWKINNKAGHYSIDLATPGLFFAVPYDEIERLKSDPDAKQLGENCKVTAVSALHKTQEHKGCLPLYSRTSEDTSLMSMALSADIGSTVGELYDAQQIGLLSEKAGVPLTAYETDNVTTYLNLLKKLLSAQKAVMIIFNVMPDGPSAGFPEEVTDKNKACEHAALAVGYFESSQGLFFLVFHWGRLWFFKAEILASSALSLPTFHNSEEFIEVCKNGKIEFINTLFLQSYLHDGATLSQDPPKTCASKMSPSSLRGTLFAIRDSSNTKKIRASDAVPRDEAVSSFEL